MHSLIIQYSEVGRRSDALQLLEQVVEHYNSVLGNDHLESRYVRLDEGSRLHLREDWRRFAMIERCSSFMMCKIVRMSDQR